MITPDRRILPAAQAVLIDPTGRATPTLYDFMRRIIGVTGLTPELIQQIEEILEKLEELEDGGFMPITSNVIGEDSIISQGVLSAGVVTLQLQGDTSDQRSTWYYGSNEVSAKGWFRFYTALAAGAGILKRNSGYIELGEVDDPADLPAIGNLGEAYWVDGASDITERGLWAWDGAAWVLDPAATGIVSFELDGGGLFSRGATFVSGSAISVPVNDVPVRIPIACTITKVTVLTLGGTGSCVLDIWKDTYANYPPTVADSITASAKPTIVSGIKYEDSTLTGWTTAVAAGDVLMFHLESSSAFTTIVISLELQP